MVIERMFVQNATTNRGHQFPRVWRLRVWRLRRRSLPGLILRINPRCSIKAQDPGNAHGAGDEGGISHLGVIRRNLFLVDEDEVVVLYAVMISAEACLRTGAKRENVVRTDLALVLIEVDMSRFPTAAMPLGA